jgi:hypothetical protein
MELKDKMAKDLYGRTLTEAWEARVCVCHGDPVDEMNLAGRDAREYEISGCTWWPRNLQPLPHWLGDGLQYTI